MKTLQKDFLEEGNIPIVDQGQKLIAGYTNDRASICKAKLPVIIFGDHTKIIKYVDFEFAIGADGVKVLTTKEKGNVKYFYHALKFARIPDAGYSRHYKFLKEIEVCFPPLVEQKRIAAILDAAEGLRAKRRQALKELDTFLQATFFHMFGDPVTNPMGWDFCQIEDLCDSKDDIKCGPFGTQLQVHEFKESGIPLWGIKHVNSQFAFSTNEFVSDAKYQSLKQYSLRSGDIVMTRKGTVGNCCIYPADFAIGVMHSDLLRLRVSSTRCNPVFIRFQLTLSPQVKQQIVLMSPGAVMPGINVSKLKKLVVEVPPLALQQQFAAIVESVERQKVVMKAHLAELDDLFGSLQQRAFNGEL